MNDKLAIFRLSNRHAAIAVVFAILALLLGGGGSPSPAPELWVELLAGCAVIAWIWSAGRSASPAPADPWLWLLAGLALLLPIVQLVPLPPAIWTALPGREVESAALELIGKANSWRPISLSPPQTLASLLSIVPPVLLLAMTAALPPAQRRWVMAAIAGLAVLAVFIGALQLSGNDGALRFYPPYQTQGIVGFQANRNATADLFLVGIVGVAALSVPATGGDRARRQSRGARSQGTMRFGGLWAGIAIVLLVLATVLTGSRAGIALLPVALAAVWLIRREDEADARFRALPAFAAAGFALAILGVLALRNVQALHWVAERFDTTRDARTNLWADTLFAIGQYWPVGSGVGTFVQSFIAAERLDFVDPSVPNRAHDDYLELALEGGVAGIAILAVIVALLVVLAVRAWRQRPQDRPQVVFGIAALIIVALHSIVDYPMRSMALASIAAVGAGLLAIPPRQFPKERQAFRAAT